ncbi:MAG: hypothetical protein JST43_09135 [Bacteroidetes bacterium]|nr:hypothetical protein [Bacteroidota bacterium]MBS1539011.1 hypothetical protein [Bacteroidota bacterium]
MQLTLTKQLLWLVVFSIAMGFLEGAVVVYLRMVYYPNGFAFPLATLDFRTGLVELLREAATIIMLAGVSILGGKNKYQRWAFFLIAFAVWDLIYYVALKLILDWPTSFFTWDILFLIPVPWVGPVLSPIIVCFLMFLLAAIILWKEYKQQPLKFHWRELTLLFGGSFVMILSWTWNFITYSGSIASTPHQSLQTLSTYVPDIFNWPLFGIGGIMICLAIVSYWRKQK